MQAKLIISMVGIAILAGLQYCFWFYDGGISTQVHIKRKIAAQIAENERLSQENKKLMAEVADLKSGMASIEDRARSELGLIKQDEQYFLVVQNDGHA